MTSECATPPDWLEACVMCRGPWQWVSIYSIFSKHSIITDSGLGCVFKKERKHLWSEAPWIAGWLAALFTFAKNHHTNINLVDKGVCTNNRPFITCQVIKCLLFATTCISIYCYTIYGNTFAPLISLESHLALNQYQIVLILLLFSFLWFVCLKQEVAAFIFPGSLCAVTFGLPAISGGGWSVAAEITLKYSVIVLNIWASKCKDRPNQPKTSDKVLELSDSVVLLWAVTKKSLLKSGRFVSRAKSQNRKPRTSSAVVQVFLLASAKIRCCHLRNNFLSVWYQVFSILWMLSVRFVWVSLSTTLTFGFWNLSGLLNWCVCVCVLCACVCVG